MKRILMSLPLFGLALFAAGCGSGDVPTEEEAAERSEQETQEIEDQLPADL